MPSHSESEALLLLNSEDKQVAVLDGVGDGNKCLVVIPGISLCEVAC